MLAENRCSQKKEQHRRPPGYGYMYAIGIIPLIQKLKGIAKQSWYADDSAAASNLPQLRQWWNMLNELGPMYGYFPNGNKTHILAKLQHLNRAKEIFKDTPITISAEGKTYLGGAMGTNVFAELHVKEKVKTWEREIERLSLYAETQPHAAYTAFTNGLNSKWNYLLRVTKWDKLPLTNLLQPLESTIQNRFIPAVSGQATLGKLTRDLLVLLVHLGGLGLCNPLITAEEQHKTSTQLCTPLVERIVNQDHHIGSCLEDQLEIKSRIRSQKRSDQKESAKKVYD